MTRQTDALGSSTTYEYSAGGYLAKVTDALGAAVKYSYDKLGNKLSMTDGRGKLTRYAYTSLGALKSVTNAENKAQTYRYDLEGNLALITDKNGNNTVYTYDSTGNLLERRVQETGDSIGYTYDEAGNRTSMTDESGRSTYSYDKNGRLFEIRKGAALQLSYEYDRAGNISRVTDLKGRAVSYTYDRSNRLETVASSGKTTTYAYDENGRRTGVEYEGGVTESYSYDRDNQLVRLVNKKPGGAVLSEYSYTYDLAGRQTAKTDSFGTTEYTYDKAGRVLRVAAPGKLTVYAYDSAGNRVSQNETYTSQQPSGYVDGGTGKDIQYILKKSDYAYSSANLLLRLTERLLDSEGRELARKLTKYAYDDNGNQLRQSVSHILPDSTKLRPSTKDTAYGDELEGEIDSLIEKTSYTYDGFNRLNNTETIKAGERTAAEYIYDGDDLRVSKTVRKSGSGYRAEVTNYLYDRQNVILETDAEGNTRASYVKGINYVSKTDGENRVSYYLFNGHGDVVQTVDAAGNTQNQYEYDIWGNPVLTIEASENAIRYAGEFLDLETGLYYLRARFYDPYIGRFTTEDSYWGEDENPLSLNLYTYCANDPVRYVDPSGHVWMYNAGGRLQDVEQKDVSGATQVGYSLAKDVTMYNSGGFSSQVAVSDISRAEQVGFVLPQLIYNSTDTVNVSSGVVINYSNIQNMNIAANAHVFVENRGFIDTLFSDKGSSMTLDNYGKVRAVNIGEGAVANIFNYNQEKDPETNEYIKSIEVITGGLKSNINLFNYGGVGEVHTGDYSENLVYNENEEAYVNWLETGLGNSSGTDQGTRYYSGRGSIKVISDLDKLKANLYKLGYINVYKDYASARNQFLKDYLDNGHSLDADFKRMGSGDHYSSLLNWTNKALAGKYTHTTDGRNKGNANDFVNGFIEHFTDKVDAAKKYYSELFSNPLEKTIEVYTDPRTIAKLNPSTDMLLQAYDMGIIAYSDYKLLLSGDKQALLKRAGDASGELLEIIALSLVLKKFGTFEGTGKVVEGGTGFLSKPATSNGTLNIGAGSKPISGAYNIDINPSATGVYAGDAANLSGIVSGSQSRIVIQNPYNFNALNSEISRVLKKGGTIEISGGMSNKWFNSIYKMSESELNSLGYSTVSRGQATSAGTGFTIQGEAIKSNIMEIVLKKIK